MTSVLPVSFRVDAAVTQSPGETVSPSLPAVVPPPSPAVSSNPSPGTGFGITGTLVPAQKIGFIVKSSTVYNNHRYYTETFYEIKDSNALGKVEQLVGKIRNDHNLPDAEVDFTHLMLIPKNGAKPLPLMDGEVKELREIFESQFPKLSVERHQFDPHARGDMLGGPCLIAPSARTQRLKEITADDFIARFKQKLTARPGRENLIRHAETFLKNRKKEFDRLIADQRNKVILAVRQPAEREKEEKLLKALEEMQDEWHCDCFVMYYALANAEDEQTVFDLKQASEKVNESIEELELFIDPGKNHGRMIGMLRTAATILPKIHFEGDLTDEEKRYCHDVALLCARDRIEYVVLCFGAGFPLKKDPFEWLLVRLFLQGVWSPDANKEFEEHPILKAWQERVTPELWDQIHNGSQRSAPPASVSSIASH